MSNQNLRILGKGKTALAIKESYKNAILYDDNDKELYDINSEDLTVVSPGIPPHNYLVKNTKNLISEYDLFQKDMPFNIWISGTNGKTTTTQMLQHILEEKGSVCGGNIGTPLSNLDKKAKIWILETSSFTLHYTTQAKPNIYLLLPISDDHLSWHGSFKEYENSKLKPLDLMDENDTAIIPEVYKDYKTKAKIITYKNSLDLAEKFDMNITNIKFREPFLMDSILALSIEKMLFDTISYDKMNTFIQDAHRLEELKDSRGRIWVDDSKATNVDAAIQALKSYNDKKIFLIFGGEDKGMELTPLFEELKKYDAQIFAIGANVLKLEALADKFNITCTVSNTLELAVQNISNNFEEDTNTVALLSPAAASFDQFSSYEHRGDEFKKFVALI